MLISLNFLTSEQANLFLPQALCICWSSCLECFQVKYHLLREAFLDYLSGVAPPTPTGAHHSFISFTALLLSKITSLTYLLTCFFSVSSTRMFHHKGRDPVCLICHCILSSLNSACCSYPPRSDHATAPLR